MLILGIESSCDETGVALYDTQHAAVALDASKGLLADVLHSQIDLHRAYGGVVPELASRDHIRRLTPLVNQCLQLAEKSIAEIDLIAYTQGPGLGGALLTGASLATGLAFALDKPTIGIHHLEGHLLSPRLANPSPAFPFLALLVSGGHTQLMAVAGVGDYTLLGETLDDAAGEAFDKTATLLGLAYPGGPALAALADGAAAPPGCATAFALPRPMLKSGDLDFSFSGLKTAVLTAVRAEQAAGRYGEVGSAVRADLAASFQAAVVDVVCAKCLAALQQTGLRRLVVAGGVGANRALRAALTARVAAVGGQVFYPPLKLCTDNGAMIAFAAAERVGAGLLAGQPITAPRTFTVKPRWSLQEANCGK